MIELLFVITATVAIVCALITVTSHHIVHALLFMVIMMLAIALVFFLLGASFAAALQIIIYAGAIMVLFVFVTMMLHQGEQSIAQERQLFTLAKSWLPLGLTLVLLLETAVIIFNSPLIELINIGTTESSSASIEDTKQIGIVLFGRYHQLIILTALMLLSALISAINITKKPVKVSHGSDS